VQASIKQDQDHSDILVSLLQLLAVGNLRPAVRRDPQAGAADQDGRSELMLAAASGRCPGMS
jgi:hypothetical protein